MALQPAVEDVLDEGRVVDQDLREEDPALREPLPRAPSTCGVPPTVVASGDGAVHRTSAPALVGLTFSGKDGQQPNHGARGC